MTKTPKFDKALGEILDNLVPHKRFCRQCQAEFEIFGEDIEFYRKLRVPAPTLCPLCRKKRRFGHLMRMPKFFKKDCSGQNHNEEVITVFPPSSPHKIFDFTYWYSDAWQASDFGRDYDFSKLFFPQFQKLFFEVPHLPLERDPKGVNSEYVVGGTGAKNVYLTAMGFHSENIAYCFDARFSRDLVDCNIMNNSELCYDSIGSYNCNRCVSVVECGECLNSAFLFDCKNCSDCFMSVNLRHKSYVFENRQLSNEEYQKKIVSVNLGDRDVFKKYSSYFKKEVIRKALHRNVFNIRSYKSVGDGLKNCNNCYFVFRAQDLENVRYSDNMVASRDCADVVNIVNSEKIYESVLNGYGSNNKFSMYLRSNCSFLEHSVECNNCHYCFGCVGLRNKKFHIFNKSYLEKEYWLTVDKIKTKRLEQEEYGEFFPLELGLMPYQSSTGQKYFPLNEIDAKKQDIPWYEESEPDIPEGAEILKAPDEIPKDIKGINDDILNKVIICEKTGKPFQLIERELNFYRKMNLPVPAKHYWQRMGERAELEHSVWLHPFKCPKCENESFSVYSLKEQKELKIFCEKCYLKKVV